MARVTAIFSLIFAFNALNLLADVDAFPADQELLHGVTGGVVDVIAELKKAEIIPTVIDEFLPSLTLNITWHNATASLGNTISPDDVQDMPSVTLYSQDSDILSASSMTYTVTLTDPDAPSRDDPEWSEICHWIATKIKAKSSSNFHATRKLREVMPYKPPGPPPKTGKHRYVFLVFAPRNGTSEKLFLSKPGDRQHWGMDGERVGVRQWAEKNGLVPVAANFIYSQNDKQ